MLLVVACSFLRSCLFVLQGACRRQMGRATRLSRKTSEIADQMRRARLNMPARWRRAGTLARPIGGGETELAVIHRTGFMTLASTPRHLCGSASPCQVFFVVSFSWLATVGPIRRVRPFDASELAWKNDSSGLMSCATASIELTPTPSLQHGPPVPTRLIREAIRIDAERRLRSRFFA
jgi:hypothetical protein